MEIGDLFLVQVQEVSQTFTVTFSRRTLLRMMNYYESCKYPSMEAMVKGLVNEGLDLHGAVPEVTVIGAEAAA